MVEVGYEIKMS